MIFRKVRRADVPFIKSMLSHIWEIERFTRDPKTANMIISSILYHDLANHDYSEIVTADGKPVGVLLARIGPGVNFHMMWKLKSCYYSRIFRTIHRIDKIGYVEYEKVDNSFKKMQSRHLFGSELIFFIVDPKKRGKGIGKILINHYFDKCKLSGIRDICLVTDTQCDYSFYDAAGFTLEVQDSFELVLSSESIVHRTFLYSYIL